MTRVAPRSAHSLKRMAVVGRRGFSLNDKAVDAPALIVDERPVLVPLSGRDVSAARPSRSEPHAPHPFGLVCREATTNVDLRTKAAGMEPTNALTGLGSMQAYALLDAVRGRFGAGASRTWPPMCGGAASAAVAGERGSSLSRAGPSWD